VTRTFHIPILLPRDPHLPHSDPELAPHVLPERAVVLVIHLRSRREDEAVTLLREPERELLVLVVRKAGIEAVVCDEDVAAVGCTVGVDEVDALGPGHAVIAVFVLQLREARGDASLARQIGSLRSSDLPRAGLARCRKLTKWRRDRSNPAGDRLAIGIGEEE
jgi:hypothetical protein